MKYLSLWHYLVMMTVPFGIFLSLRFGLLGLIVFSVINLVICYFCPDNILPRPPPDKAGEALRTPSVQAEGTLVATYLLALIILPLISTVVVWTYSPQDVAAFILDWAWLGIINENVQMTTAYMVDATVIDANISDHALLNLKRMREVLPRLSMYVITYGIMVYFFLPALIALTTFDRTQDKRRRAIYEVTHPEGLRLLKLLRASILCFILFVGVGYVCTTPVAMLFEVSYQLSSADRAIGLIIITMTMPFCWMVVLLFADSFLAIVRTSYYP